MMQRSRKRKVHSYQVRIIGGQWKRSLLPVSVVPDLRPTPNRVRETLFNWLYTLFDGQWTALDCLDLFAGTGALGFEAASRGTRHVTMAEANRTAFSQLQATREKLRAQLLVTLMPGEALSVASRLVAEGKFFDVIFLDPPFQRDDLSGILPFCAKLLKVNGVVYIESPTLLTEDVAGKTDEDGAQWHIIRQDEAGHVCYQLLQLRQMDNLQA
jgi:16S rRNA (guanine(966)-N(2))-methyltransferase RsmD